MLRVLDLSRTRMAMPHGVRRQLQPGTGLQKQEQQEQRQQQQRQQQRQQTAHDQASAAASETRLADWGEVGGLQATQLVGLVATQLRALVLNDCFVSWDQVSKGRPAGFYPFRGDVPIMRRASWRTLHQRFVSGLTLKDPKRHAIVLHLFLLKQCTVHLAMLPHQKRILNYGDA